MDSEVQEMIREARQELRRASGVALSPDEQEQARRKAEVEALQLALLPKLGVRLNMNLLGTSTWTSGGAVIVLKADDDHVFHLRKAAEKGSYVLTMVEGDGEREIARLDGSDKLFASRILVAIGNEVESVG